MKLNELSATPGARENAFRKGRGPGSGSGKTAGRGHKGQKARSGGGVRPGFEGGQMPLYRRVPKRGFNNKRFAKHYIELNIGDLDQFEDETIVDADVLNAAGIIKLPKVNDGIKILGQGTLSRKLTVRADAFTSSSKEKIEKAGGVAEEV